MSLVWKIESTSASHPSYLYGTMHVRDRKAFTFVEKIEPLIYNTQVFATEIDLSDQKAAHFPADYLRIPNGDNLRVLIGETKYHKLQRILWKAFEIDLHHFQYTIPILTANEIANSILSKDLQLPLDAYLSQFAASIDRKMTGIETFEEHLTVLQKIPLEYQVISLIQIGKNVSKYRRQILKWAELYEKERLQQLYLSSKKSLGKMKRILLYERNVTMAKRIDQIIQEQTLFCAIGAAHLPGKTGVIRLLKQMGYQVYPC